MTRCLRFFQYHLFFSKRDIYLKDSPLHLLLDLESHLFKDTDDMKHWSVLQKDVRGEPQEALLLRQVR